MINIVVALKIWCPNWANKKIRIRCDNLPVVEVLNSGQARDYILATCDRNIWLLSALYNIGINVIHIAGSQNSVADLLSRRKDTSQRLLQNIEIYIKSSMGCPTQGLLAFQ